MHFPRSSKSTTKRWLPSVVLIAFATAAVLCALMVFYWAETKQFLIGSCQAVAGDQICNATAVRTVVGAILWGFLAFPVALILERLIPAKPAQELFSVGLKQDLCWMVFMQLCKVLFLTGFSVFLFFIFDKYLAFAQIPLISNMSGISQIIAVILLSDFLGWFHHLVRHKVPLFWQFHKIHHSQREMNYFGDYRVHPGDSIIARTINFIPFFSLELNSAVPTYVVWEIGRAWYTNFNHANIRTNYGWFRYFMVTPQSHRIHHSIEPRHMDKNFAVMFSIWDFMFRTQHMNFDEYPNTGVKDDAFPLEHTGTPITYIKTTLMQFVYPLQYLVPTILREKMKWSQFSK